MSWPGPPSKPDTTSYTVTAGREQVARWEAAAGEGRLSVGSWLAVTADTYLRELVRVGRAVVSVMSTLKLPWYQDRGAARPARTSSRR